MTGEIPRVRRVTFRDAPDHSGVVISVDGRVSLISDGSGLSLQLDAAQLRELGRQCAAVAALLAARERAAAEEAADDLARVVAAGHG